MKLIIVAIPDEAQPIINSLQLELESEAPFETYTGGDTALVVSNIGKTNAAGATSYGICRFQPKVVYNIGLAVSINPDYAYSDIISVKAVFQNDVYLPFPGPKFAYFAKDIDLESDIGKYKAGIMCTGDSFLDEPEIIDRLAKYAHLADMEGYAVARIAQLNKLPCHIYKIISNNNHKQVMKDFFDSLEQMSYHRTAELIDNLFIFNRV